MLAGKEYEESTRPAGKGIAAGRDKRADSAQRVQIPADDCRWNEQPKAGLSSYKMRHV